MRRNSSTCKQYVVKGGISKHNDTLHCKHAICPIIQYHVCKVHFRCYRNLYKSYAPIKDTNIQNPYPNNSSSLRNNTITHTSAPWRHSSSPSLSVSGRQTLQSWYSFPQNSLTVISTPQSTPTLCPFIQYHVHCPLLPISLSR